MINYYQPFLLPFLQTTPYSVPIGVRQLYYFSWEDALWDMLIQKDIPLGAEILIPDFYCMDVVVNIRTHGYTPILYPLNDQLQIDPTSFAQILRKRNAQVIIIFHAAGITSHLLKDTSWISEAKNAIIIEDCVHRLVNPQNVRLIASNHVIMDSLRKDSPLPGSFVYGSKEFLSYQPKTNFLFSRYSLLSTYYFLLFRLALTISAIANLPRLTQYSHEVILKKHDDVIGDSSVPHGGLPGIPFIHRYINFKKVERLKEEQVMEYTAQLIQRQNKSQRLYSFTIPREDYKHLHVFPIGMYGTVPKKFIEFLHSNGIIVWCKFPDSDWSKKRSVLFLPLGFHISKKDIKRTLNVILQYSL